MNIFNRRLQSSTRVGLLFPFRAVRSKNQRYGGVQTTTMTMISTSQRGSNRRCVTFSWMGIHSNQSMMRRVFSLGHRCWKMITRAFFVVIRRTRCSPSDGQVDVHKEQFGENEEEQSSDPGGNWMHMIFAMMVKIQWGDRHGRGDADDHDRGEIVNA